MSYFGVSLRNGVGLSLGTVPSLANTPLSYRLAPTLDLSFAGSDSLSPAITFSRTTNATVTGSNGLIQNAPMNLLTFSEQFDNAAWGKTASTVTANSTAAPNGTTTADKLIPDTSTGLHFVNSGASLTLTRTVTYAYSIYAKQAGYSSLWLRLLGDGGNETVSASYFDIAAGTVLSTQAGSATITNVGDGWFRCTVIGTSVSGGAGIPYVYVTNGTTLSITGNGINGLSLWGAQLELGSTATTYNPTTVKNLLGYTENFDNAAWTKSNASISATKVDDIYGQPFAQKLVENTANNVHSAALNATLTVGTPYTFSVYAKAAERSWCAVQIFGGVFAYVNLTTGAVGTTSGSPTVVVAATGSGWYRISLTSTASVTSNAPVVYIATSDGVVFYTGDGTSGIYIFGAQLSDSASVDPYVYQPVAAPTSTAYYGPRFDYDPVTLAPKGLLIEEQRVNLLTYSEQFDNAAWVKQAATVTTNATTAPDGTTAADFFVPSTANAFHRVYELAVIANATVYTYTVYAKNSGTRYLQLEMNTGFAKYANFDLVSGVVGTTDATSSSITSVGNGWYRCSMTATSTGVLGELNIVAANSSSASAFPAYVSNGTDGIYIWGAQLEAGAFATSYIPTVASQVTRAADSASMIGNNFARWYTQGVGTLFASGDRMTSSTFSSQATIDDGTTSNEIYVISNNPGYSGTTPQGSITAAGVGNGTASGTVAVGAAAKMALAFSSSNSAFSAQGASASAISGNVPSSVNRMTIGLRSSAIYLNGHVSRIAYYPRRLANTELTALTS